MEAIRQVREHCTAQANHAVAEAYGFDPDDLAYILTILPVLGRKRADFHAFLPSRVPKL